MIEDIDFYNNLVPLDDWKRQQSSRAPADPVNPNYVMEKLRPVDPIALDGIAIPERKWIVKDWVPHGNVTMLAGDGGVGKSLLAQQLMTACAIGKQFLSIETKPCRVLGIFCEDDPDELHRRQNRINERYGISFADLENMQWVSRVGSDNVVMEFEKWGDVGKPVEFFQQIHNAAQDFGAQLIVLDSLHDLFAGNENSRPQARRFINLLRELAMDCDGAVVLTAHPSLEGMRSKSGSAGSTAWSNTVRSRLYLTKPDDSGVSSTNERVLARRKANYAAQDNGIKLEWQDGSFIRTDGAVGGLAASIERTRVEDVFLTLLDRFQGEGRPVSDNSRASNYAPKLFAGRADNGGYSKKALHKAMEGLFAGSKIKMEEYGYPTDTRRKNVRIDATRDG